LFEGVQYNGAIPIRLRKDRSEIAPLVQDAHDLHSAIAHAIENHVGMNENRAQPRHDLVARSPCERSLDCQSCRAVDITKQPISHVARGHA
jgi:hypothetical protein